MIVVNNKKDVAREVSESVVQPKRYMLFCDTPAGLQKVLDSLQYYDFKDAIVIPTVNDGDKPMVCVIVENPDVRTQVALERLKKKSSAAASELLKKTGLLLEEWSEKLSSKKSQQ